MSENNLNMKHIANSIVMVYNYGKIVNPLDHQQILDNFESRGTGFIIKKLDKCYYILTCFHCIDDSVKVKVSFHSINGVKYDVKIKGMMPDYDIALLQLDFPEPNNIDGSIQPLECIDEVVERLNKVSAVGYPLGEENLKYSSGVINGWSDYLIQTDTPINQGNSGGPLLNKEFQVIGINSAKVVSADNIGYCIPIRLYLLWADELEKENCKIIYAPRLNITFSKTASSITNYYCTNNTKCNNYKGVIVNKIAENSVLKKYLEELDIIVNIGIIDGNDSIYCDIDYFGDVHLSNDHEVSSVFQNLQTLINSERMNLANFMTYVNNKHKIRLTYIRKNNDIYEKTFLMNNIAHLTIKTDYFVDETFYIKKDNVVYMLLNFNNLRSLLSICTDKNIENNLLKYLLFENRNYSRIVVTKIEYESVFFNDNILQEGDIIRKINNIDLFNCNVEDLKTQFCDEIQKDSVTMITETNTIVVKPKKIV